MNYAVIWTSRFKRYYKLLMKQGADISLLDDVIRLLSSGATLPDQWRVLPTRFLCSRGQFEMFPLFRGQYIRKLLQPELMRQKIFYNYIFFQPYILIQE